MTSLCECGKSNRYVVASEPEPVYSCNKYVRCPTWKQLNEQNFELHQKIAKYEELMDLFNVLLKGRRQSP